MADILTSSLRGSSQSAVGLQLDIQVHATEISCLFTKKRARFMFLGSSHWSEGALFDGRSLLLLL